MPRSTDSFQTSRQSEGSGGIKGIGALGEVKLRRSIEISVSQLTDYEQSSESYASGSPNKINDHPTSNILV